MATGERRLQIGQGAVPREGHTRAHTQSGTMIVSSWRLVGALMARLRPVPFLPPGPLSSRKLSADFHLKVGEARRVALARSPTATYGKQER